MVDTKLHDACVRKIVSEWCGKSLQQLIDIDIDSGGSNLQIEQIGLKGQNVPAVFASMGCNCLWNGQRWKINLFRPICLSPRKSAPPLGFTQRRHLFLFSYDYSSFAWWVNAIDTTKSCKKCRLTKWPTWSVEVPIEMACICNMHRQPCCKRIEVEVTRSKPINIQLFLVFVPYLCSVWTVKRIKWWQIWKSSQHGVVKVKECIFWSWQAGVSDQVICASWVLIGWKCCQKLNLPLQWTKENGIMTSA